MSKWIFSIWGTTDEARIAKHILNYCVLQLLYIFIYVIYTFQRLSGSNVNRQTWLLHLIPLGSWTRINEPISTVVCSVTWPLNGSEAEVTLFWYRPHYICCINQVALMRIRCIYMTRSERSVSKHGHLHGPLCHLKARLSSRQLQNERLKIKDSS